MEVRVLAAIFKSLETVLPGLVPPLGLAILKLTEYDLEENAELKVGLSLQQQTLFFKSKLYSTFLGARFLAKWEKARRNVSASVEIRQNEVKALLADTSISPDQKTTLEIVATIFGNAEDGTKKQFVLEKPERLDVLATWDGGHELLELRPLVDRSFAWKDFASEQFLKLFLSIAKLKVCVACVANPVVKQLLGVLGKMLGHSEHAPAEAAALVERLIGVAFVEIARAKLEIGDDKIPEEVFR